jgi:hypothetical protein
METRPRSPSIADPGGEPIALELADLMLRIATGTSPEYVASLVAALRSGC